METYGLSFCGGNMRYHFKLGLITSSIYAEVYICDHLVYRKCTLYRDGDKGLAVVQQRYSAESKKTWWTDIDAWLVDTIYMEPKFKIVFDKYAAKPQNGLYPTLSVRQLMWRLRMKPLKRQPWETVFDKCPI